MIGLKSSTLKHLTQWRVIDENDHYRALKIVEELRVYVIYSNYFQQSWEFSYIVSILCKMDGGSKTSNTHQRRLQQVDGNEEPSIKPERDTTAQDERSAELLFT